MRAIGVFRASVQARPSRRAPRVRVEERVPAVEGPRAFADELFDGDAGSSGAAWQPGWLPPRPRSDASELQLAAKILITVPGFFRIVF